MGPKCQASFDAGKLYIHVANEPHELGGCIAPGCIEGTQGVLQSNRAFSFLCQGLGVIDPSGEFLYGVRAEVEIIDV